MVTWTEVNGQTSDAKNPITAFSQIPSRSLQFIGLANGNVIIRRVQAATNARQSFTLTPIENAHAGGVLSLIGNLRLGSTTILATAGKDNNVKVWNLTDTTLIATLAHSDWVNSLIVLPNGDLASGSKDKTIKVWDLVNKKEKATLTSHTGGIQAFALLKTGELVSGDDQGKVGILCFRLFSILNFEIYFFHFSKNILI